MTFRIGPPYLCLLILSLYSASVTALILDFEFTAPASYWVDQSCIEKGFPPSTARESLLMATRGARRLLNFNDAYQAWLFRLLFKVPRDFGLFGEDPESLAWNVVEQEGWIGAMSYEVNRADAEVLVYCDNDARWTLVPDDPTSIEAGYTANSERTFGGDAEYEDVVNVMRRETSNRGCDAVGALGVTYSALVGDEESRRQTITICDVALGSAIKKFGDIPFMAWSFLEMSPMALIPTFVLLHQFLVLQPYTSVYGLGTYTVNDDSWEGMLVMTAGRLAELPAPYAWNAVLAYAADIGWGVKPNLTPTQYLAGQNLLSFSLDIQHPPFLLGGPIELPTWLTLPSGVYEPQ